MGNYTEEATGTYPRETKLVPPGCRLYSCLNAPLDDSGGGRTSPYACDYLLESAPGNATHLDTV